MQAGADYEASNIQARAITVNGKDSRFRIKSGLWKGYHHDLMEAMTPWEWHKPLLIMLKDQNKLFSSPFDETAVQFLEQEIDPNCTK